MGSGMEDTVWVIRAAEAGRSGSGSRNRVWEVVGARNEPVSQSVCAGQRRREGRDVGGPAHLQCD